MSAEVMSLIISNVKDKMDPEDRDILYRDLIEYFENENCDTLYECLEEDTVFDKAYEEISIFEKEEDIILSDDADWDGQDNSQF